MKIYAIVTSSYKDPDFYELIQSEILFMSIDKQKALDKFEEFRKNWIYKTDKNYTCDLEEFEDGECYYNGNHYDVIDTIQNYEY